MPLMENYDSWLPMDEVKRQTGMSERTIYRMVQEGKLRQARRPIPGRKPLPVFDPADVAELAALALRSRPQIMPPDGKMAQTEPVKELAQALADALVLAAHAITHDNAARLLPMAKSAEKPLYVTIDEAKELTGLSAAAIQRAARDGRVKKIGRVYRRADLEKM